MSVEISQIQNATSNKCHQEAFADVKTETSTSVFAKADSIYASKNTPEALAKEAEKMTEAEKKEKIRDIEIQILENKEKMELYKKRLSQKVISREEYRADILDKTAWGKAVNNTCIGGTLGILAGWGMGFAGYSLLTPIVLGLSGVALLGSMAIKIVQHVDDAWGCSSPGAFREEYKEAYLMAEQENEQLQTQLIELQK
jgi:hypothetical protein